jgi:predicted MFS family arabinose efflux permease
MLLVLCATAFLGILNSIAIGPFLPSLAAEFGVSVSLLGQIPALTMLGGAFLGLVVGPLADHYGYRRALTLGVFAAIASALAIAGAAAPAFLLLAALFGAASRAAVIPVTLAIASARFGGDAQRRAISFINSSVSVSAIAGIPVLTAVAALHGWRASFVALAIAGAATFVAIRLVLPVNAGEHRSPTQSQEPLTLARIASSYLPLFRSPTARSAQGIFLASLLRNVTAWGFLTYLGAFLVDRHAFTAQQVGWAFMASGLGHFSGSLLIGGRIGAGGGAPLRAAFALLHVLSGVLFAAAYLLPLAPLAAVLFFAVAALVTGGADVTGVRLLVAESPAGRATTLTLNGSGMSVGSAIGSSLGGLLLAFGGFPAIAAMVLVAGLAAAAAVAWLSRARPSAYTPAIDALIREIDSLGAHQKLWRYLYRSRRATPLDTIERDLTTLRDRLTTEVPPTT